MICHATTSPPIISPPGPVIAAISGPPDHVWHFKWSGWTIHGAIVGPSLPQLVPHVRNSINSQAICMRQLVVWPLMILAMNAPLGHLSQHSLATMYFSRIRENSIVHNSPSSLNGCFKRGPTKAS